MQLNYLNITKKTQVTLQPVFLLILLILSKPSFSQLTVDATANTEQLVNSAVGPGYTVTSIKFNCPAGASALFTSISTNLGLEKGILLTTGKAAFAIGPNNSTNMGYNSGAPGDLQLDSLTGTETYDGCAVEFDVIPTCDTLRIRYVFGSEEYPEYINKQFHDAFGFFISGPGITGNKNIAVDALSSSSYFIDNKGGTTLQYDGITKPLTATEHVIANSTYHLKIVIADAADGIFDSGVFIEEGSLGNSPIGKDAERCGAGILDLAAKAPAGVLNWYSAQTGGGLIYTGTNYVVNLSQTTIFYVESAQTTCISSRIAVTGTINPEIAKPSITESNGILSAPVGYTYQWYFNKVLLSGETNQTYTPAQTGNYSVVVTNAKNCSATSDEFSFIVGIKSISFDAQVQIYPNPANEIIFIQTPLNGNKNLTMSIYSILGKLLFQETYANVNQPYAVNTAAIANGIYFIQLQSGNEIITRKVTIHH
jgi:hypothetical protein